MQKKSIKINQFQTRKTSLIDSRLVNQQLDLEIYNSGSIVLKIEKLSFTSNNISYGVAGEKLGYWKFFPPLKNKSNEWGCIPAWGFAKVIHSKNENLMIGEKFFGYFPLADILIFDEVNISGNTMIDMSKHRKELPLVYNTYIKVSDNPDDETDNLKALLFPLHVTAFCLCDFLQDVSYYQSEQILILSASSKTAIGLAQGLDEIKGVPDTIGVTSPNNIDFVKDLKSYTHILSYEDLDKISHNKKTVIIDMSGNRKILGSLHNSLKENMIKCITVGMTHWDSETIPKDILSQMMIRERTEFFFAPTHIKKRTKDWGERGFNKKINTFMKARIIQSKNWIKIKEIKGLNNFSSMYDNFTRGTIKPEEGLIITL
ncbi:MAG: hypothetical protein CMM14_04370 [Rhodospirillaceae bacterium]|nr:hypothetical protein [Rhodospirillaceae bacterium]